MNNFWMDLKDVIASCTQIALVAIFAQNIIFTRALGTSASLFVIRKRYNLGFFGLIMAIITTLSSCIIYFLRRPINNLKYVYFLRPVIYVAIVGVVYVLILLFCGKFLKKHIDNIRPMVHIFFLGFCLCLRIFPKYRRTSFL